MKRRRRAETDTTQVIDRPNDSYDESSKLNDKRARLSLSSRTVTNHSCKKKYFLIRWAQKTTRQSVATDPWLGQNNCLVNGQAIGVDCWEETGLEQEIPFHPSDHPDPLPLWTWCLHNSIEQLGSFCLTG